MLEAFAVLVLGGILILVLWGDELATIGLLLGTLLVRFVRRRKGK